MKQKFGKEPSISDVLWSVYNKMTIAHAVKRNWGLYRNNKFQMAELLKIESKLKQSLGLFLEVCIFDLNGSNNLGSVDQEFIKSVGYKEFDPKIAFLAPGVISRINSIIKKIDMSLNNLKKLFYDKYDFVQKSVRLPVSVDDAWIKLKAALS